LAEFDLKSAFNCPISLAWIALHSVARGSVTDVSRFGMSFIDVLASSDTLQCVLQV
jgi:hypothetical protein